LKDEQMNRDPKRSAQHKARTVSRRKARHLKSARLFLCWAFPAPAFPTAVQAEG
jgi:hypothetical protein